MLQKIDINANPIRTILHIVFWITYLLFFVALAKINLPEVPFLRITFRTGIFSLPVDIIATYFAIYVLMPFLLYKRKYIAFSIAFLFSSVLFALLVHAIDYYFYVPRFYPERAYKQSFWVFPYFFYIVSTNSVVIFAVAIKLGKRWFEVQNRANILEAQNLKSELAMLKHQLSPHFLFNTLNNIDSLIHYDQDKASTAIIRLSDIMRYMLYNSEQKFVLLSKEIEYIRNVIKLQELRMKGKDVIQLDIEGKPGNYKVAPLLFIPFIENAIKHRDKSIEDQGIQIRMTIDGQSLRFKAVNKVDKDQPKDDTGGIGLQNVKRRLKLLYPERHTLRINETYGNFEVELMIPLTV